MPPATEAATAPPTPVADTEASFDRTAAGDFNTLKAAGNNVPVGIWTRGSAYDWTTLWVADSQDRKIYAYDLKTKARVASKEFDTLDGGGERRSAGHLVQWQHHVGLGLR